MLRNEISSLLSRYRKSIYTALILPTAALVIYQSIDSFIFPLPYLSLSKVHLAVLFFTELLFFYISFDIYHRSRSQQKASLTWQLAFWVVLLNLIATYVLSAFYESRAVYPLVAMILTFVPAVKVALILCVLLCLWKGYGKLIVNIWNSFSFADGKEDPQEKKWITIAILLTSFIIGVGLRLYNLANFPAYVDEYIHIHAAANVLGGGPLTWDRAYLTVSLPVYLSYSLFGMSLWTSRLPMVLINMLAVFPLYFLGKKINQWVGYISVFLYVLSPWIIAVSRTVRDYAVVPVFFYLAALMLVDLLDWEDLSAKQYLSHYKYQIIVTAMILGYALFDNLSILKIIVAVYGIFGFLVLLKIWKTNPTRWFKIAAIFLGGVCSLFLLVFSWLSRRFLATGSIFYKIDLTSWYSLVSNNVRQWYTIGALSYMVFFLGGLFVIRSVFAHYRKKDFIVALCYLAFTATLVYLVYLLVNPFVATRVRYGILVEYWYVIVVAVVLYVVFYACQRIFGKRFLIIPIVIAIALFFNYQAIDTVFTYQGGGVFQVTGERHYIVEPAYDYLVEHMDDKDVLVTDIMSTYDLISDRQLGDDKVISFHSDDPLTIIGEYPQGWIAVTAASHPERTDLHFSDFNYAGKNIHYLGLVGEVNLWQWTGPSPH